MNKETFKKYQREFHGFVQWDPNEEGRTPFVEIDKAKATHVVKRCLTEMKEKEKFEKKSDKTLYKTLQSFYFGDLVLFMAGKIDSSKLYDKIGTTSPANDTKYEFVMEPNEEMIEAYREAQSTLMELGSIKTVESSLGELVIPEGAAKTAIDTLLAGEKLPSIEDILSKVGEAEYKAKVSDLEARDALNAKDLSEQEVSRLSNELADMAIKAMNAPSQEVEIEGDGTIPDGKMVFKKMSELFPEHKMDVDFEVPYWEWEGVHPYVPQVDNHYIFRPELLARTLYAIVTNKRMYLQGHTGTGKTTLIEQIAAHLNYPVIRVNMDSEITRMDLIGRDVLTTDEDGNTVSQFIDGILPRAMSNPCFLIVDEIDFVRPDVAYVMQAALEGNGLRITEDGDRLVKPNPNMRMFATGNTVGQGDEFGMYQGARPQSLALLDRFQVWAKVDYLTDKERNDLVKRHYPMLKDEDRNVICKYVTEHLTAFREASIVQPISPRGMLAIAEAFVLMKDLKQAVTMTTLDKANQEDRTTLNGIVSRVIK